VVIHLGLIATMLGPQLWAARKGFSPAGHLSLLMLSLIVVTCAVVFVGVQLTPASQGRTATLKLSYIGYSAMGLAGLIPLFWALQKMFPSYRFALVTVLAQSLSLAFTAMLFTLASGSAMPSVLEWGTLALTVALYGAGLHVVHYGTLE
jgi:hypothetical protein